MRFRKGHGRSGLPRSGGPLLLALALLGLMACESAPPHQTLERILATGEITVITRNNAHCFYLDRDQPVGFEHDLARAFADYLGVKLKIKIADDWPRMLPLLMNGGGAFIAASLAVTPARQQQVAFSDWYLETRQHLIVHRDNGGIKSTEDLDGHTIHIRKDSAHQEHLYDLRAMGHNFEIRATHDSPPEALIQQVAERKIEVTIADSHIALLNRRYYPQTLIADPISAKQFLAWATHPDARQLLARMNAFFKQIKTTGQFTEIYNRYFSGLEQFDYVDVSIYHRRLKRRLPRYSPFIKDAAKQHGFDWRLIAAQIYQESHFNPKARSHRGAFGLMQITPNTAQGLGVVDILDPVENIYAGVQHLRGLYDRFAELEPQNRLLFALAAYNVGFGHVEDARHLAAQLGLEPDEWSSLAETLPLLRYKKYYQNAAYGYCRGTEPVDYIRQIQLYYDILKRKDIDIAPGKTPVQREM